MGSLSPEHKQVACIKTGSSDLAAGAEVVLKGGRDSIGVPREDTKDRLRFDRVVGA